VFHAGGSILDVTRLRVTRGRVEGVDILATADLGGEAWDRRLMEHLVNAFRERHGVDLSRDRMAMQRITEAAEKTKIELSALTHTNVELPYVTATEAGPLHLSESITRTQFEAMTQDLADRCQSTFTAAFDGARERLTDVDHVILEGGATAIPAVGSLLQLYGLSGREPLQGLDPGLIAALGAARLAATLKRTP
jgi:molecular chaperone DnaK